jgi:hypothetical protein
MMRRRAALCVLLATACLAAPSAARAEFGFVPGSVTVSAENSDGSADTLASSHPYNFVLHLDLNTDKNGFIEGGEVRDVKFQLPPGLYGSPLAAPRCTHQGFEGQLPSCPLGSQVGVVKAIQPGIGEIFAPLYNLVPSPGIPAEFGFSAVGFFGFPAAELPPETPGYPVLVSTANIPIEVSSITATIWGVPADPVHDAERGPKGGLKLPVGEPERAFLTLPASCQQPIKVTVSADSKLDPGNFISQTAEALVGGEPAVLTGCAQVPFAPSLASSITSGSASASSGFNFGLNLPLQGLEAPKSISETEPERIEVALPPGFTANASAAAGLEGCSTDQFRQASIVDQGCPDTSKLGTLSARSPLIEEPIEGSIYLAAPLHNPFGALLSLYIVATAPERGVLIKQAGHVDVDQSTGQLTTTFDGLPPLPYSSLKLNLREGPKAPLTTPLACGSYQAVARFYPFSEPTMAAVRNVPLTISSGAERTGCVGSESQLPNAPTFEAGTQTPLAGLYSPFTLKMSRGEASQHFQALNVTLPPGLVGKIAETAECSDSQIAQAASRSGEGEGALEQAGPSCPASSEIGTVTVGAGSGTPLYVEGHAYLAGPYKGAPLSMVIITPAVAGPFDLGTVTVRAALYVNESTAQITVKSDQIPASLHGIPLDVRSIAVQVAKSNFTLNPTSCEAMQVGGEEISTAGQTAKLKNRFQVGGCSGLAFKPNLKLFFTGQTKRTGFPAIKAVLTQPKGDNANLAGATVILPKGMLIANAHINNPCTRVQFNSVGLPGDGCPAKSILGTAKVWTPLLANPEEGKVYFRSNGGERQLPDMVVALRGKVPLQLVGFIDSVGKKGAEVRRVRSRFQSVPDAPVSRFELKLSGGKKGLLESSKNLCRSQNKASFKLSGQNGKVYDTEPDIQVTCKKKKSAK